MELNAYSESPSRSTSDMGMSNQAMAPSYTDERSYSSFPTESEYSSRLDIDSTDVSHASPVQPKTAPNGRAVIMSWVTASRSVDEWFILSFISVLFCFPLGIAAIVKSLQGHRELRYGDVTKANLSFAAVKFFVSIAFLSGLMIPPIVGIARYHSAN
ncbi:uncharacterized protein [Ptychodera flava]|uniref:uncharacterized protein n=1 Tax=Ptychodera flava TaxID=63121 RepID=UPI00396A1B17